MCLKEPHEGNLLKVRGFWAPSPGLYCCSSLFCYVFFVGLASADKPGDDALLDISEDGLTDHALIEHLSHVGYRGSILNLPRWASAQLNTLVFRDFWNRERLYGL